jgi:FkbM family methyltransferase
MPKMKIKDIIKIVLPRKLISVLRNVENVYFDGYALKSYSQEGEDIILRRLFGNQTKGFYIDVGAHHPKCLSNTYFFYKQGWRGINIDAMPGSMKLFKELRPRDINIEQAVSDKKEILTYYIFNEPAFNGFSKELSNRRNGLGNYRIVSELKLETVPLREILDNYLPTGQSIDFLSVDVEGLDLEVLRSNDWQRYRPNLVIVEAIGTKFDEVLQSELYDFLSSKGYQLFAKLMNTLIFTLK